MNNETTLIIRPNRSYHLASTDIRLNKHNLYQGEIATNQPNYKEKGLIFVMGCILLNKNEYTIIQGGK